jgi:O-antigen/teichoic acid export membrane protein
VITLARAGAGFLPAIAAFALADGASLIFAANGLGVAEVGYLGVAVRLASVAGLLTSAFSMAWAPVALRMNPSAVSMSIFTRVIQSYLLIAAVATLGVGALSPELVAIAAGPAFAPAAILVPSLLFGAALSGILYVLSTAAGISNAGNAAGKSSLVGAAGQILLALTLMPALGLIGLGIASLAGRVLAALWLATSVAHAAGIGSRKLGAFLGVGVTAVAVSTIVCIDPSGTEPLRLGLGVAATVGALLVILKGPRLDADWASAASRD